MGVQFYCGITEPIWNYHPVSPGAFGCVAPVMGSRDNSRKESNVLVPDDCVVIQDSGAFCDSLAGRLSFSDALRRQDAHARKYNYEHKITHQATYDLLIDEKWDGGVRRKSRWTVDEAELAVDETIRAAEFLNQHRNGYGLVLSAQGVSTEQYYRCASSVLELATNKDIFGLGGWCVIGRNRNNLRKDFRSIITKVIPLVAQSPIHRVHVWGVVYAPALGELLWLCNQYGLGLSTDSSGPQKRPVFGIWGYADWKDKSYQQPPTTIRGQERARHVVVVREWLSGLEHTQYYQSPYREEIWA